MPRFSDLDYDFSCPHRDGCPYLEGLSTRWVLMNYQCPHCHGSDLQPVDEQREHLQEDIVLEPRVVTTSSLGFDSQAARKGLPLYQDIHSKIKASPLAHADETFWRHDGKNSFVWYAGRQDLAYFQFVQHRSTKEAQALLGENFAGTLVADAYASYNGTHPRARQSCLSHLIRKAKELDQTLALLAPKFQDPAARLLCQKAADLFSRTCHAAHLFDRGELSACQALAQEKEFRGELNGLCRRTLSYPPAQSFRKRLLGPEQALFFTCLREPNVPPTNNQAEQSLRPIVIMRKVIQCTRGKAGLENHSVLHTLVQTARRQGRAARHFLETLLTQDTSTAQAALYRNTS
jgi:transposase